MHIHAKFAGRCSCGEVIRVGDEVSWNPQNRRLEGCRLCRWSGKGEEEQEGYYSSMDDWYPIIHGDW